MFPSASWATEELYLPSGLVVRGSLEQEQYAEQNIPNSSDMVVRGTLDVADEPLSNKIIASDHWTLRSSPFTAKRTVRTETILATREPVGDISVGSFRGFIHSSLENSNSLKSRLHSANAAHHALRSETFQLLPSITLTGELERSNTDNNLTLSSPLGNSESVAVSANWTIFSSGARWGAINSASFSALSADAQYLASERQVFLDNTSTYLQVYGNQELVRSIEKTLVRFEENTCGHCAVI